jgi:hypothetical protein
MSSSYVRLRPIFLASMGQGSRSSWRDRVRRLPFSRLTVAILALLAACSDLPTDPSPSIEPSTRAEQALGRDVSVPCYTSVYNAGGEPLYRYGFRELHLPRTADSPSGARRLYKLYVGDGRG